MQSTRPAANPFGLLMNPQDVLRAVEASENLRGLNQRVCRPLDRPLGPRQSGSAAEFDEQVEDAEEASDASGPVKGT